MSSNKGNAPKKQTTKTAKPAKKADKPAKDLQTPSPEPGESKKSVPAKRMIETLTSDPLTPVTVTFEGTTASTKPSKQAKFSHTLKLQATTQFHLSKTVMIEDGPHKGSQAILLTPAKTFPFMKLSPELREQVYKHYFAPTNAEYIEVDAKRNATKEVYAKKYAGGSKYRVGLLAVCKDITAAALPVLYNHTIRFDSSGYLLELLTQLPPSHRSMLKKIIVQNYQKTNARTAFNLLSDAAQVKRVTIKTGITTDDDVKKAVKGFHTDVSKFLETRLSSTNDVDGTMKIIKFGPCALATKDGIKLKPWSAEKVEEFKDALQEKLT